MNKGDLTEALLKVLSTRREAQAALDTMVETIRQAIRRGDKVVLSGLGSFHVKWRKAKVGRNPKTGVTVPVPARRVVRFKESQDLWGHPGSQND